MYVNHWTGKKKNPIAIWESIFKSKGVHLVVGFDEAATKASPQLMPEARRNLCRGAPHTEHRDDSDDPLNYYFLHGDKLQQ